MKEEKLIAEMSVDEKKKKAEEIFQDFNKKYIPQGLPGYCQHDFKMCSLVAYKLVRELYDPDGKLDKNLIASTWGSKYDVCLPLMEAIWLPIRSF